MTGSAKLAWIITVLSLGICTAVPARAAAPRDAIRKLPSIVSTTRIITQNDNNEQFSSTWDVNWNTGEIKLNRMTAQLNFKYQLNLQDNQEVEQDFTRNIRQDVYEFRMDLKTGGYANGSYVFNHVENSSDVNPSQRQRNQFLNDFKNVNIEVNPPQGFRFSMTASERNNVSYDGYSQSRGSDELYWKGFTELRGNTPRGNYNVQVHNENRLSRDLFGTDRVETSSNKFVVIGHRDMEIGNMGRLNMDMNYEVNTSQNNRQDEAGGNTALWYQLAFGGKLPNYPMNYNYRFVSRHWGNLSTAGNRSMEREVTLRYNPPVPEGRELVLVYVNNLQDFDNGNNSSGTTRQNLTMSFRPNKRTQVQVLYNLQNDFNNITREITRDEATLESNLNYNAPGGRNSYQFGYQQKQFVGPNRRDRTEYSKYSYRAGSRLGENANLSMEMSQSYNDSYNAQNLVNTPTENLQTRVVYDFTSGQMQGGAGGNFRLNAQWERNLLRRATSFQKNDQHGLNINMAYNTNANWTYQLILQSNSGWSYTGASGNNFDFTERYTNSDRIEAIVTHRF
ncbi:MAG: hypothetical protein H7A35_11770 [Planctomycetales bacterium]|nr:hypothetical protein [bacterium]UNM07536.1 MAG: hypothetical protein H7A35_11770 [Planctomycetales bacterium]